MLQQTTQQSSRSVQQQVLEGYLKERDAEIARLRERVGSLSEQLHRALYSQSSTSNSHNNSDSPSSAPNENNSVGSGGVGVGVAGSDHKRNKTTAKRTHLSPHAVQVHTANSTGGGGSGASATAFAGPSSALGIRQERLGRNASIGTQRVLHDLSMAAMASSSSSSATVSLAAGLHHQPSGRGVDSRQRGGGSSNSFLRGSSSGGGIVPASQSLGSGDAGTPVSRVLQMFASPASSLEYLASPLFARDLVKLCSAAKKILGQEPRCLFLQSPIYVFGDVHGNVEDLHFFADNIWRLGMECTAGRFLFLGDYVDRGLSCLECIAYLLALKVTIPNKLYLLRGNHETRDVNGWEEHYGDRSFIRQCTNRFGNDVGYRVWEACNAAFDRMPLAAVIDQDIFCVHGGIPRPIFPDGRTTRIQDILTVPRVAGINPPYQHEDSIYQQVASDCIWSDPASEEQELTSVDPITGYGASLRGGGAICFGNKAVTDFLAQHNLSYILRAHEAHAEGVAISKGARVFTVFSTSKDHNQGSHALAGCILVDNEKLQVINRSPAYRNQYVHRRDSVSLASVPPDEIQKRLRLGLITQAPPGAATRASQYQPEADAGANNDTSMQGTTPSDDEELQDWQDFESDSEDEEDIGDNREGNDDYDHDEAMETAVAAAASASIQQPSSTTGKHHVFDTNRRASIDLASLSENSHGDPAKIHEAPAAPEGGAWSSSSALQQYQQMLMAGAVAAGDGLGGNDPPDAGRRMIRSKKPSISSIPEDDIRHRRRRRDDDVASEDFCDDAMCGDLEEDEDAGL